MSNQEQTNYSRHGNTTHDETKLWLEFFGGNSPLIILDLLIVYINATILVAFSRKRPLKTATNLFLVGMASTDLITGLFSIPFFIACNATYHCREELCHVKEPLYAFTSLSTIEFIAVITADRYLAIMKPLRYKVLVTKKRAKLIITMIWIISVFLALLPFVWVAPGKITLTAPTESLRRADRIYTIAILCPIVLALPFIVYSYVKIVKEIRRQRKTTRSQSKPNGSSPSNLAQQARTVTIFCVMLAGYVFCWAPLVILRIFQNFNYMPFHESLYIIVYVIMILPFVTSFLNPCCYGFGKRDFRRAISESSHCKAPRHFVDFSRKYACTQC